MKPIIPRRNKVNLVKSYDFKRIVAFFIFQTKTPPPMIASKKTWALVLTLT